MVGDHGKEKEIDGNQSHVGIIILRGIGLNSTIRKSKG